MSVVDWTTISGSVQGDVNYTFSKSLATKEYVDFDLSAYSSKWDTFDIAFEYRLDSRDTWRTDAVITQTTAKYIRGNKLYALSLLSYKATVHKIRWEYPSNDLLFGTVPEVRIRVLPKVRAFSSANQQHTVSQIYGDSFADIEGQTDKQVIGTDNNGDFVVIDGTSVSIFDSLSDTTAIRSFSSLVSPVHVIQTDAGGYIICDYGNDRVIEVDSDMTAITKTYAIESPVFSDFFESEETLLVVSDVLNRVDEVSWATGSFGNLVWQSTYALSLPKSATYRLGDSSFIVISDYGNNDIVKYDSGLDTYEAVSFYRLSNDEGVVPHELSLFKSPIRSYWYEDGNILVVEEDGAVLDFATIESSSSSSSVDSSSSSSSSS